MRMSKTVSAANISEARRLLANLRSKTSPATVVSAEITKRRRHPADTVPGEALQTVWRKTEWSETLFEPRG